MNVVCCSIHFVPALHITLPYNMQPLDQKFSYIYGTHVNDFITTNGVKLKYTRSTFVHVLIIIIFLFQFNFLNLKSFILVYLCFYYT